MKIPLNHIIHTKNYQLRAPDESDFDFVFSTGNYPGFHDGMLWSAPVTIDDLKKPLQRNLQSWKDGSAYAFTIESLISSSERLGRISIRKTEKKDIWNILKN